MQVLREEEHKGFVYAIVGGAALSAWASELYEPVRENGTIRDIDIVVLEDPVNSVAEITRKLESKNGFNIPVDFNTVKNQEYRQQFQMLSHFKRTGRHYSIIFRKVEHGLPEEVTELHYVDLKTAGATHSFATFNPHTLVHLYIHRVGSLKRKDVAKVRSFMRKCHSHKTCKDHGVYRTFHEYSRRVRASYPIYSLCIRLYNYLDKVLFNCLLSHKIIPRRLYRAAISL